MGCLCDKSEFEVLEDLIDKACEMTELASKHCDKISKSIHRTTLHFHLTDKQLKESLSYMKIEESPEKLKIFELFQEMPKDCKFIDRQNMRKDYGQDYTMKMYSVKKLTTFGVLLGKGSVDEKASCLFSVYDIDASNNLSKWEISILINDVLDIVLEKIPDFTAEVFPEAKDKMSSYKEKLLVMRQNFLDYFKYLLLEDKRKEMTGEEFVEAMGKSDMKIMLDHVRVRKNLIKNYEHCHQIFREFQQEEFDFNESKLPEDELVTKIV
jgi:hypothetical protein